ncbi:hypothetical protein N008_20770 [Hymenobacter sp. APR13]|nr:hypothetical protein N008_20770 [Hymenobacter sp. APR13]
MLNALRVWNGPRGTGVTWGRTDTHRGASLHLLASDAGHDAGNGLVAFGFRSEYGVLKRWEKTRAGDQPLFKATGRKTLSG